MKTKELVTIAILAALLYIVQVAFSFLPNIELVSLLILIYTLVFDKMTLKIIAVFIILEGVQWGFGLWWWSYIYVWQILYFVVRWLKKFIRIDDSISWAVVLGFYGLFFGMLFSLAYILISPSYAFTYWVSGILFDVIHCIGNFCLCLIAYKPLYAILKRFR